MKYVTGNITAVLQTFMHPFLCKFYELFTRLIALLTFHFKSVLYETIAAALGSFVLNKRTIQKSISEIFQPYLMLDLCEFSAGFYNILMSSSDIICAYASLKNY